MDPHFNWIRVARYSCAIAATAALAFSAPLIWASVDEAREREAAELRLALARKASEPHPRPATNAQQAAIVRSLLSRSEPDASPDGIKQRPLRLRRQTSTLCAKSLGVPCPENLLISSGDTLASEDSDWQDPHVPLKLRRELVIANAMATSQPDPRVPGVEFSRGEFEEPGATYINFSRAVLSEDGRTALISMSEACGNLCASERVFLLVRSREGWRVEGQHLMWIS